MLLGHWDVRGAGQPVRNLLHYLGMPYKEIKYPTEDSWFKEARGKLESNFPNLPYIVDDGKTITESQAILVYICLKAKRMDLLGKNLEGEIHFIQVRSFWADLRKLFYEIAFDKKDPDVIATLREKCVPLFAILSKHLGKNEWICGFLTVMDFVLAEGIEWMMIQEGDLLKGMENLKELVGRVYALPGVKEHMASDELPKYFLWESYANKGLKICY